MSRFSRYDTDDERLPEGMQRVGYDADTQVYTYQDHDGSYWESAPGNQYGQLTRVSDGPQEGAADDEPFLIHDDVRRPSPSWRADMRPFLNFGLIIGLCLLLLFWFLYRSAGGDSEPEPQPEPQPQCVDGLESYTVVKGDTCWAIGDERGITVDDILKANKGLDCDKLAVGAQICLPA